MLSVAVVSATGLLPADSNGLSDPYVRLKLGANGEEKKTLVMPKTLNPCAAYPLHAE